MTKKILLLSGFDPTAQAGILRDIQACHHFHKKYYAIPLALTAQNQNIYTGTETPSYAFLKKMFLNLEIKNIDCVKIGMLAHEKNVEFVIQILLQLKKNNRHIRVIWDPVLYSSSGGQLLNKKGLHTALAELLPLIDIFTPNALEACAILQIDYDEGLSGTDLAKALYEKFKIPVLVKGGHLRHQAKDYYCDGKKLRIYSTTKHSGILRGSGCLMATTLAIQLAKKNNPHTAIRKSKTFISQVFSGKVILY